MKKRLLSFLIVAMSGLQAMALSTTDYLANNYVETWGHLKLVTTKNSGVNKVQLADKNGLAVQLRGWATHGYQWSGSNPYFNQKSDFEAIKRLGANVVRLTCYVSQNSSVSQNAWNNTKIWVKNAIDWCEQLGIYAVVDYHVYNPGNPNEYLLSSTNTNIREKAETFFSDISAYVKEKDYYHVIYEICNEPNPASGSGGPSWTAITDYANVILPIIAENDPHAVVIVGTPQWSQLLSSARANPIIHSTLQIMYTFHIYTCTHTLTNLSVTNLRAIPVFVTEWNNTESTGRGSCPASTRYIDFLNRCNTDDDQRVSWTSWSWSAIVTESGQDRTSSAWSRGTVADGTGYQVANLSQTGFMIYNELQNNHLNYDAYSNVTTAKGATFSIYPNPGNGSFYVNLNSNESAVLTILNLQGQSVYSTIIENGYAAINTGLSPGIYIVSIQSESGLRTQKLVVK